MPKVVFDTVIFVRALLNLHSLYGRLIFEYFKSYRLFLSAQLIEEILEVLGRKEIINRFHLREVDYPKAIARLLKAISYAEIVRIDQIPAISRDSQDDKFLVTAKEAEAHYLVSADNDLLDLKEYEGIKIITAEEFLNIIQQE